MTIEKDARVYPQDSDREVQPTPASYRSRCKKTTKTSSTTESDVQMKNASEYAGTLMGFPMPDSNNPAHR